MDLKKFATETRNHNSMKLDRMSALEIVALMNQEDRKICPAIEEVLPEIAKLVETVASAFEKGGRLIYMGAGTSGRLGVLDASECPPTYGVSPDMVVGIMAGGDYALRNDVVGDEDKPELGKQNLVEVNLTKEDVVVGIAASGRTPFVIGGLEYAKELGCTTAAIDEADQSAKLAITKILTGTDMATAKRLLEEAKGRVYVAIQLAQEK